MVTENPVNGESEDTDMAIEQAVATNVLDRAEHRMLIKDLPHFAKVANVPAAMVYEPMSKYCGQAEVDWTANIPNNSNHGIHGMVYLGSGFTPRVDLRMAAIACGCLRNFIDARVLPVSKLTVGKGEEVPNPTVLLIPNFCDSQAVNISPWHKAAMSDLIVQRQLEGKQTVVYADSLERMMSIYGEHVVDIIGNAYTAIA